MDWRAKLKQMADGYAAQITAFESQIAQLTSRATELQDQANALNMAQLVNKTSLAGILEQKRAAFATTLGGTCTTHLGKGFGTTNLTSWYIYYHGDNPLDDNARIVYKFGKQGWDNDKTLCCLINEFNFFLDYIVVDINTGLYGLESARSLINEGISRLEDMIAKYSAAKRRLEVFANTGFSACLIDPIFG